MCSIELLQKRDKVKKSQLPKFQTSEKLASFNVLIIRKEKKRDSIVFTRFSSFINSNNKNNFNAALKYPNTK